MSYSKYNWLNALALPLAVAGLQTSWTYLWVLALGLWINTAGAVELLPPASVYVLALLGQVAARRLLRTAWSLRVVRLALILLGLLAALVVSKLQHSPSRAWLDAAWILGPMGDLPRIFSEPSAPLIAALVGFAIWWLGVRAGQGSLSFPEVENTFWIGLLASFGALATLALVDGRGVTASRAGGYTLLFFGCSLFALALARLEQVQANIRSTAESTVGANRHWLLAVGTTVLGVMLLTLLAAQVVAFDLVGLLAGPVGAVYGLFETVLLILLLPIAWVVGLVAEWIRSLLTGKPQPQIQPPGDIAGMRDIVSGQQPFGLSPEVLLILKWVLVGGLLLGTLLLLARAIGRRNAATRPDLVVEERASVWSWDAFRAALLAWLTGLRRRLWPRNRAVTIETASATAVPEAVSPAALSIREVYRALLNEAGTVGWARRPQETPYEYERRLDSIVDANVDELSTITAGYVRARYAADPPPERLVAVVPAAWSELRGRLRPPSSSPGAT